MKLIKKVFSVILVCAIVFSLASCSLVNSDDTDITNDNIKIGVLLDDTVEAKSGDAGITLSAINSVTSIGYGIDSDRFKYSESVDPSDSTAVANALKSLVNFECNIIFASNPEYYDDIMAIADANPSVLFAVYNCAGNGKNVYGFRANITGASYLSGIAAGMKAAQLKVPQIGFVVANENNLTTINAFAAGAVSANPDVKIQAIVSTDAKTSATTLAKNGCVVIASDFDDQAIADVATAENIFFVGFGTDSFATGTGEENAPEYEKAFLCAPVYDFTQYYIDTIKAVVDATAVKDYNGGYITGATFLSDLSDSTIADGTKEAVEKASTELSKGTLSFEVSATVPNACVTIVK